MRLLNVANLALEEFVGEVGHGIPIYAILSHLWETEEVSFMEYITGNCRHKKGYEKIINCCRLAESEGFQYVWVDTCCIDKTSSAELYEAINSMFQWYHDAAICYAYLADVDSTEDPTVQGSSFASSRWFTRGWTLQELLAPAEVVFLGSDWAEICTKKPLRATISAITRINEEALEGLWSKYSVAQKMSWAAGRRTTRLEDEAYCLMGLFDVNMPLLYGEGRKAFSRLQQEILKLSEDQSIFAWSYPNEYHSHTQLSGLLALSPEQFREASQIEVSRHGGESENPFEIANRLVRIRLRLLENVKAMKLQTLRSEPFLYNTVEICQNKQPEEVGLPNYSTPSTPRIPDDRFAEDKMNSQAQTPLEVPMIRIEGEDRGSEPILEKSEDDSQLMGVSDTYGISMDESKTESTNTTRYWIWYIYEPITIVPLRCHIGGSQLGILLSRGSVESTRLKVLSRLHNPSIVAINAAAQPSSFTSSTTTYASMSRSMPIDPGYGEAYGLDRFSWPEIRIAGVLSAGYVLLGDCGLGWTNDRLRGALTQARRFQTEADMIECAPLIVCYHDSGNDIVHPTFFVTISEYSKLRGACTVYVGLVQASATMLIVLDYKLFSFDLAQERRVEAPLGNGRVLVVKLREGGTVTFISLSVEISSRRKPSEEREPNEPAEIGWLTSRLFPILRVLQKNNSIVLGR